ncbi:hypothetical protein [Treponema sp. R6D11]
MALNPSTSLPLVGWPPDATTLTVNFWADGVFPPSPNKEECFNFIATASTQYIHVIFGTLNTYSGLYIQIYDSDGNNIGNKTNLAVYEKNISRTLTVGDTYYIRVWPYSSNGTFQIAFNSIPILLNNTTILTINNWADGNIASAGGEQWFKFTATNTTQYIHISFGTLYDMYVQLYDSGLNTVGSETNIYGSTKYISRTLIVAQEYYIKVTPYDSSGRGTYKIAFNTSSTAPTLP